LLDEASVYDVDEVPRGVLASRQLELYEESGEVPVKACIDKADNDLRNAVPIFIDLDISLTWRLGHMSRNPL
jgi:hypothetical protein